MHELAVTESVLEIVLRYADQSGASRVTDLYMVIGELASIVDDSVQFYWDLISEGTLAEKASLHFERLPAKVICLECGTEYTPPPDFLPCPTCNSVRVKVVQGEEFYLSAIDIEKDPELERS